MRKRKNIILENIRMEDYAAEGKSLAKIDGKVVFVESTVPGDVVDVRLFKNKKDWAEGYPVRFHEYSAERVTPFCSHFGVCGGCQWQMLPYEKQLEYKQKQVEETLKRIGKVELPPISPIIGAAETRFYRNKLEYTFSNRRFLLTSELNDPSISAEQNVVGFHANGIFDKIIDVNKCFLQPEPTNEFRLAVKWFAGQHDYSFYDIKNHKGFLRTMQVRICTTGEQMLNIVLGNDDKEKIKKLLDFILQKFPGLTTLLYTINQKWNDSMQDLEPEVYFGKGYVIEKMNGAPGEEYYFKIGPKSFFQTNTMQAERLYKVAREFAELTGTETVYDLYCGTGSIGIFLGRRAKKIIGVEILEEAVRDARENAALNKLSATTEFFAGEVTSLCTDEFFSTHGVPDVIITDPPRAGMSRTLVQKIVDTAAPLVVYVSCNPATQARDLAMLGERYTVTKVQPVDMFPHTHHIENVIQLKLKPQV